MSTAQQVEADVSLKRILMVDDDAQLLAGLARALESQGYVTRSVTQSSRAMEAVDTFDPDLVVLDVMMPHVDGWEVLRLLRERDGGGDVPVIMLTAADSDAAKLRGFELGADDYLTKPFSVQELRCRIAAVLRRSTVHSDGGESLCSIPVVVGGSDVEFVKCKDVFYVEGVRNYTYIHTSTVRYLSRMTLGAIEQSQIEGFKRVHRSFIVNLRHVKGCGWSGRSSYHLRLADASMTEVPVSRSLVPEVQRLLGVRS